MQREDSDNLGSLRNFLSRHPVAVEAARSGSASASAQCQVVIFERSWAYVLAGSSGEILQPRRLVGSEIDLKARGGLVDEEAYPIPSQVAEDGSDPISFSAPIIGNDQSVVGAITVFESVGEATREVLESLGRSLTGLIASSDQVDSLGGPVSLDPGDLVNGLRDAVILLGQDLEIMWANEAVASLLLRTPADLIGRNAVDLVHPDDLDLALDSLARISSGLTLYRQVIRIETGNGDWGPVEVTGTDQTGNAAIRGIVLSLRSSEIDEEKRKSSAQQTAMSESLLEHLHDGMIATDAVGAITVVNGAARELFGISRETPPGALTWRDFPLLDQLGALVERKNHPVRVLFGAKFESGSELSVVSLTGGHHYVSVAQRSVPDKEGKTQGSFVTFHDVTETRHAKTELLSQALHDQLTGLPNRRMLGEYLVDLKFNASVREQTVAACFLDIDIFKLVNDTHGHRTGDQMIRVAAERLSETLRSGDLLVRLGGDEFVALLADVESASSAKETAERLRECMKQPFLIGGLRFDITASVGVALSEASKIDSDTLLRHADIALYAAKARGRNRTVVFDQALEVATEIEERQRRMLRHALDNDGIVMHFQPLVDSDTGELIGVEALARCLDEEGVLHGPSNFLESIAGSGLIWELDQRAFYLSCRAASVIAGLSKVIAPIVACNFSPLSIIQPDFVNFITSTVANAGIEANNVCIEITESAAFAGGEASLSALNELGKLGYLIALDDFGTGYSSLSHLLDLPLTSVKVDRSFVTKLHEASPERSIAEAVVGLASNLGLGIVAEGVETAGQLEAAKNLGFNVIQGWHFAPAMPLDELLQSWVQSEAFSD